MSRRKEEKQLKKNLDANRKKLSRKRRKKSDKSGYKKRRNDLNLKKKE